MVPSVRPPGNDQRLEDPETAWAMFRCSWSRQWDRCEALPSLFMNAGAVAESNVLRIAASR